jgi:hypothetical protein
MNNPTITDDVFDFARELVENNDLRVTDKEQELLKYYPGTSEAIKPYLDNIEIIKSNEFCLQTR